MSVQQTELLELKEGEELFPKVGQAMGEEPPSPSVDLNHEGTRYMKSVIMLSLMLAAAACDRGEAPSGTNPQADTKTGTPAVAADNTKKNERDQDKAALTPTDQGENEADRGVTQAIRQGIVKDDTLSMTAKNIKIITVDGVVTLRGPVKSDKEKTDIAAMVQHVAGVKRVDNQLEIAPN